MTKWGNACLNGSGHYQIAGGQYHHKLLHRLVWEEEYVVNRVSDGVICIMLMVKRSLLRVLPLKG